MAAFCESSASACLLEVAPPKMSADGQRGHNAPRNKGNKKRVAQRRRDAVHLVGAGIRATGNYPNAFHKAGVGNVKLMREESSRGYAGHRDTARLELLVSCKRLD